MAAPAQAERSWTVDDPDLPDGHEVVDGRLVPRRQERVWEVDDPDVPERCEIVDGRLLPKLMPGVRHSQVAARLARQLARQLPPGWEELGEFTLRLGRGSRDPDAGVVRHPPRSSPDLQNGYDPADVALAVEVVSPGSRTTDRLLKPAQYADAGIGTYWRVETDPDVVVHVHRLVDGTYREVAQVRGVEQVDDPFPLTLDVPALTA